MMNTRGKSDGPVVPGKSPNKAEEPAAEAMVIGGASLFAQTLDRVERIYLTLIESEVEGDTWFPELDLKEWREVWREEHPKDGRHVYPFSFILLERRRAD